MPFGVCDHIKGDLTTHLNSGLFIIEQMGDTAILLLGRGWLSILNSMDYFKFN